jgi:hypothetical protein
VWRQTEITPTLRLAIPAEHLYLMSKHQIEWNATNEKWFCVRCLRALDHISKQDAKVELAVRLHLARIARADFGEGMIGT